MNSTEKLYVVLKSVKFVGFEFKTLSEFWAVIFKCYKISFNNNKKHSPPYRKLNTPLLHFQCDICKEWFKSRDTIRAHMNYVHVQGPQVQIIAVVILMKLIFQASLCWFFFLY